MHHHTHDLLSPVPGTARQVHSFHYGPQNGSGKVYIQASLHADELPGMLVAWYLKQRLAELESAGRLLGEVVVVPVANPIGLEQVLMDTPLGRYELESGQNFNRWFSDLGAQVGDDIEARLTADAEHNAALVRDSLRAALDAVPANTQLQSLRLTLQRLACDADMVLDLHCDFESVEHLYTTPEAWPKVEPLSRYLGAQASLLATDSGGQSFDECFTLVWWQLQQRFGERFPIPMGSFSVTLELRGQGDVNHALASRDCQAIIHYLIDAGIIDGERQPLPELLYPATPLAAVEPVTTPVGGLLVFCAMPGEHVEAGQLIAEVIDPISDTVACIHALNAGLLYARSLRRMATAGMVIAHIAGTQAYRSGYLLSP
ncbi:succinylglutamate desuccinylase [Pseudomonas amygdali pv. tabaci str. ATCC 11528]|uniref:succinylglutamate desuccinylase/aspartoacylase family protein n=2 Tax=Pseudomonas TaxID=286 RepID=UPI0002098BF0|nr:MULTISPECIES: succinylglutamate desuccinylase/aspartoacylase family protein [Pseudomonas syringae group]KKY53038.1 succinylglutamate desuccinylase [Pseudomonas amygdali pv. tabaci str. ATCC 11528]MDU8605162.1 M14 family metallopeptidase [Pseudomonas syringae group sp. 247E2]QED86038.1 succinylglutamate desuccinylase [Pseudomonas amygdali pv. tabaci str. ATCC 11528]